MVASRICQSSIKSQDDPICPKSPSPRWFWRPGRDFLHGQGGSGSSLFCASLESGMIKCLLKRNREQKLYLLHVSVGRYTKDQSGLAFCHFWFKSAFMIFWILPRSCVQFGHLKIHIFCCCLNFDMNTNQATLLFDHLHLLSQLWHCPGDISPSEANRSHAEAREDHSGTHGSVIQGPRWQKWCWLVAFVELWIIRKTKLSRQQESIWSHYLSQIKLCVGWVGGALGGLWGNCWVTQPGPALRIVPWPPPERKRLLWKFVEYFPSTTFSHKLM